MDPKQAFDKALKQATSCIQHIHSDQLNLPTPCTEWNLKQLTNHLVYELSWIPDLISGKTVAEIGDKYEGDLLGSDIRKAWGIVAAAASEAIAGADLDSTVNLSWGNVPAREYIIEVGRDVCIHGWDIAQATNCNLIIEPELAQFYYDNTLPHADSLSRGGGFAPAIEVPKDSDIQTKLLALLGRQAKKV